MDESLPRRQLAVNQLQMAQHSASLWTIGIGEIVKSSWDHLK